MDPSTAYPPTYTYPPPTHTPTNIQNCGHGIKIHPRPNTIPTQYYHPDPKFIPDQTSSRPESKFTPDQTLLHVDILPPVKNPTW